MPVGTLVRILVLTKHILTLSKPASGITPNLGPSAEAEAPPKTYLEVK